MERTRLYLGFLVFLLGILGGCSPVISYHEIKGSLSRVIYQDGISEDEAVILAQNYIISRGLADRLHSLTPFDVKKRDVWDNGNEEIEFVVPPGDNFQHPVQKSWRVLFKDKKGSFFHGAYPIMPFFVEVDRQNGTILNWGIQK